MEGEVTQAKGEEDGMRMEDFTIEMVEKMDREISKRNPINRSQQFKEALKEKLTKKGNDQDESDPEFVPGSEEECADEDEEDEDEDEDKDEEDEDSLEDEDGSDLEDEDDDIVEIEADDTPKVATIEKRMVVGTKPTFVKKVEAKASVKPTPNRAAKKTTAPPKPQLKAAAKVTYGVEKTIKRKTPPAVKATAKPVDGK